VVEDEGEAAAERAVVQATAVIDAFPAFFQACLLRGQRAKLGLDEAAAADDVDTALVDDWLGLLQAHAVDFTLGWRRLADAAAGDEAPLRALVPDAQALQPWLARWRARSADDAPVPPQERVQRMRRANPWIIARNHRVEEALEAASERSDLGPFERLLAALRDPYEEKPAHAGYAEPAPAAVTACYQTFCGT
jgi:uncharacterized protein YdiU (UPF0061 family)